MIIELFDQMIRTKMGGEMLTFINETKNSNNEDLKQFLKNRCGENIFDDHTSTKIPLKDKISIDKIQNKMLNIYLKCVRYLIPHHLRDEIFINTSIGERHKYMYDRYSLPNLLYKIPFKDIEILDYKNSNIPHFNDYCLDINKDGTGEGINLDFTAQIAESSQIPTIASGGFSSEYELEIILQSNCINGVIVGKAFYEGWVNLKDIFVKYPT